LVSGGLGDQGDLAGRGHDRRTISSTAWPPAGRWAVFGKPLSLMPSCAEHIGRVERRAGERRLGAQIDRNLSALPQAPT
jgi:hypothetical protein